MRKLLVFLIAFFFMMTSFGQELISTDGDYSLNGSGTLSWTIGEIVVQTAEASNGILTQGFQQDYENILDVIGIDGLLTFSLFPNPFHNKITIQSPENISYSIRIMDSHSKIVMEKHLVIESSFSTTIDLSFLSVGVYYVDIHRKNSTQHLFKSILKYK